MSLLTLYNITEASGNPTSLPQIAGGSVFILPGGAGVQNTGQVANPFLGSPRVEQVVREVLDATVVNGVPTPVPTGSVLAVNLLAPNNTGSAIFTAPLGVAAPALPGQYGIVLKPGSSLAVDDLPVGSGVGAQIVEEGPVLGLCIAPAAGGGIVPGTLLGSDGTGNLQPFQPPSAAPTPVVTPIGGSATSYSYALVAISANGTYSAVGANGTTAAGVATLTNAAYNAISWTPVDDAQGGYIILRTASSGSPATVGAIGQVPYGVHTFNDVGLAILAGTTASQPFAQTAAPGAPTIAQVAGAVAGTTTYTYSVSAILPNGVWSAASSTTSLTTSNAVLSAVNANKITWTNVAGAVQYAVNRTAAGGNPSTTGFIGFATSGTTGLIDYGQAATTFTQQTTPNPTPPSGVTLARSMGTLASGTTTPTLTPVFVGSF